MATRWPGPFAITSDAGDPWILLTLRTGGLGEQIALQWSDIDWHGRFISVQRNPVRGVIRRRSRISADMFAQLFTSLLRVAPAPACPERQTPSPNRCSSNDALQPSATPAQPEADPAEMVMRAKSLRMSA